MKIAESIEYPGTDEAFYLTLADTDRMLKENDWDPSYGFNSSRTYWPDPGYFTTLLENVDAAIQLCLSCVVGDQWEDVPTIHIPTAEETLQHWDDDLDRFIASRDKYWYIGAEEAYDRLCNIGHLDEYWDTSDDDHGINRKEGLVKHK